MINDLGWRDLADRRRNTCLMLFYKIVNYVVNVPSELIHIPAIGGNRKRQAHNNVMHVGSNIDVTNILSTPGPSQNGKNLPALLLTLQVLRPSRIG